MPKVDAIKVFDIRSHSDPEKKYRVQFDGTKWYCDCMSWIYNHEHEGDGTGIRECKHTREAEGLMRTQGAKAYRVIQSVGPWFEQLQQYVASLVDLSKNGGVSPEKLVGFHQDYGRFEEEFQKLEDSTSAAKTMLGLYKTLLLQVSGEVSERGTPGRRT